MHEVRIWRWSDGDIFEKRPMHTESVEHAHTEGSRIYVNEALATVIKVERQGDDSEDVYVREVVFG